MSDLHINSQFESSDTAAFNLPRISENNSANALNMLLPFLPSLVNSNDLSNGCDFGIHDGTFR